MKRMIAFLLLLLCLAMPVLAAQTQDGRYTVEVTMTGGTGRVTIASPAEVTAADGVLTATIVWSSSNYDRMTVDGVDYYPSTMEENSTFQIPIRLDEDMEIMAETLAMSQPHDIAYTLHFDSATLTPVEEADAAVWPAVVLCALAVVAAAILIWKRPWAKRGAALLLALALLPGITGCGAEDEAESWVHTPEESFCGLTYTGSLDLSYAHEFAVDYYDGGYSLISIASGDQFLVVPEGGEIPQTDVPILQQPISDIYLVATAAMCLFDALDGLDAISLSGTQADGWTIDNARSAMENGDILYAGKYSEPDYELIASNGCSLSIQSTMIYHTPEVKEKLEELGIPVLVDYSSYETHPLGRTEWLKLYAAILGKEAEAQSLFDAQVEKMTQVMAESSTGKTVAFFYVSASGGYAVVRKSGDYVTKMIDLAGGTYIYSEIGDSDTTTATVKLSMEEFYATANTADIVIYNSSSMGGELHSLEEFLALNPLLADFKAVAEGNVWCIGANLYQDMTQLGTVMEEMHAVFTGAAQDEMLFLYRLQ